MARCIKKQRPKTQICVGSLNKRIDIFTRTFNPPIDAITGSIVSTEDFTLLEQVWAMVESPVGVTVFDDIDTERVISTIFSIRFIPGLTSENWIVFKEQRYDILRIMNYEYNNLYHQLFCALSGAESAEAARA